MTSMTEPQTRSAGMWPRALPIATILIVAVLGYVLFRDSLSFEALSAHRERALAFRDAHYVWAALGFVAAYVVIVAFSLPGALVASLTGGFLFGMFPGTLFNMVAATVGATVIFLAARWGLGAHLAARMDASDGRIKRLKQGIDENQWSMLFLIRLVPVVPFFVANLIPALVGVPLMRFVVSTFLGIIPGALVYTSVGAGLSEVFERGESPNLGILFEPHILLPILGLCVLAALPMLLRVLRGDKRP
ncbi:TVP38/TMEM64 family protein [Shimia biformata]|uniref:TVP38/TMEM64 family protein n=1 Tax=Shimia biformata TaxID=1294299 RepID=UPI003B831606